MALQNFVDYSGPTIAAAWLNGVDILKFTVFADATTKATARAALTSDLPLEVANGGTGSRTAVGVVALAPAPTIVSAATIAPTTPIAFVSGVVTIQTITPPASIAAGGGMITLIPTGLWSTNTLGNIALASTAVVGKALMLTYDFSTSKWYPSY